MVKYVFIVYEQDSGEKFAQVVTDIDHMVDTINVLKDIGMVKGYIVDDKENGNGN